MQVELFFLMTLLTLITGRGLAGDLTEEPTTVQAKLDADCEAARQQKLVTARAKLVSECVRSKEYPDRKSCEDSYANYGQRVGKQPPLFYDLPACVKAYEHQTSYRSSDN